MQVPAFRVLEKAARSIRMLHVLVPRGTFDGRELLLVGLLRAHLEVDFLELIAHLPGPISLLKRQVEESR